MDHVTSVPLENITDIELGEDGESGSEGSNDRSSNQFERLVGIAVPTLFGLIVAVGLVGNLVVVLVVALHRRARTATSLLMLNLAVADLVFIVVCVPTTAIRLALPVWPFGVVWCKIYQYTAMVTAYASVYTLVLMAIDRFLAIVHPITSMKWRTTRRTGVALTILWILVCCGSCPNWYVVFSYHYKSQDRTDCINQLLYRPDGGRTNRRIYYTAFFLAGYALPLSIICILYFLLLRRISARRIPGSSVSNEPQAAETVRFCNGDGAVEIQSTNVVATTRTVATNSASTSLKAVHARRRVMRMVTGVVLTFAACWLPVHVAWLVESYCTVSLAHSAFATYFFAFQIVGMCLAYLNSCANPIIYAFVSENFRHSFRELLCGAAVGTGYRGTDCGRRLELLPPRLKRFRRKNIGADAGDGVSDAIGTVGDRLTVGNGSLSTTLTGGQQHRQRQQRRWWKKKSVSGADDDGRYDDPSSCPAAESGYHRIAFQFSPTSTTEVNGLANSSRTALVGRSPFIIGDEQPPLPLLET